MPALAAAVTPIMKLLVAVDTLNGMSIARSMAMTLSAPDPMPSRPEMAPAPNIIANPSLTRCTKYGLAPAGVGSDPFNFRRTASGSGAEGAETACGGRAERYAEHKSTTPKITASVETGTREASSAPQIAPVVVAISRNMPMRILESPSATYAEAAPDDVA